MAAPVSGSSLPCLFQPLGRGGARPMPPARRCAAWEMCEMRRHSVARPGMDDEYTHKAVRRTHENTLEVTYFMNGTGLFCRAQRLIRT